MEVDIDERLLNAFKRIRKSYKNGLAVVKVSRGACGGCFGYIPPQTQSEIRTKKTIMICEHCGRIIADIDDSAVFISDEEMAS
jgi:predicted  nucleic acid-binding Zn-ribbon protein